MIRRQSLVFVLFLGFCTNLNSQTFLTGKIYEKATDSLISGVNVFNATTRLLVQSGKDGSYTIAATEGNQLIFSAAGYQSETVTVTYSMLLTQYDVTLSIQVISLKAVEVTGSYRADSLARRNYYQHIYEKQAGITGRNRPADGVGVIVSPLSFFSNESRQKRQLKKRLIEQEQEAFIDHSFPIEWVEKLTGLHGDSLRLFMYRYRPSYSFCRKTSSEGMLMYVNDKLKEFKKPAVKN